MEKKQPKSTEDEIDLLFYLSQLKVWLNKLVTFVSSYFHLLWRNFFLFSLIVLLITAAAFCLRYVIPPAYRTNGIFVSRYLTAAYCDIMVQDLDQLIREKNLPIVAEQLNLSPQVASAIREIDVTPLRDTLLERKYGIFSPFQVTILLAKMDHLEPIQGGLIYYLEGGYLEQERKRKREEHREELRSAIRKLGYKGDTTRVDSSGLRTIIEQLEEPDKIEIVRPLLKRIHPNAPNYQQYLQRGFLVAILAGLILTPLAGKKRLPPRGKAIA